MNRNEGKKSAEEKKYYCSIELNYSTFKEKFNSRAKVYV
jgi:hypothetical protein